MTKTSDSVATGSTKETSESLRIHQFRHEKHIMHESAFTLGRRLFYQYESSKILNNQSLRCLQCAFPSYSIFYSELVGPTGFHGQPETDKQLRVDQDCFEFRGKGSTGRCTKKICFLIP